LANTKYIKTQTSVTKKFLISKESLKTKVTSFKEKTKDNLNPKGNRESEMKKD